MPCRLPPAFILCAKALFALVLVNLASASSARSGGKPQIDVDPGSFVCASPSPRLLSMGERYYDLAPQAHRHHGQAWHPGIDSPTDNQPTPAERIFAESEIHGLLDQLSDTRWRQGVGQRMRCLGSARAVHAQWSDTQLQDILVRGKYTSASTRTASWRINHSATQRNGELEENHRAVYGDLQIDLREYDEQRKLLRYQALRLPIESLIQLDSSTTLINARERYRQKTLGGSQLRETNTQALLRDDSVQIEQSLYVNGTLAEWFAWELRSD